MRVNKREIIFKTEYLKVKRAYFTSKSGVEGAWDYLEKTSVPFVVIFAVTKDRKVILERNYRIPVEGTVLELPSGLNDNKGETEPEAARRELLEETGYWADKIIPVFKCLISPASLPAIASYYFAPDVVYIHPPKGDGVEEIEIIEVPLEELVDFICRESEKGKVCERVSAVIPILKHKGLI